MTAKVMVFALPEVGQRVTVSVRAPSMSLVLSEDGDVLAACIDHRALRHWGIAHGAVVSMSAGDEDVEP